MPENLETINSSGSLVESLGLRSPVDLSMKGGERIIAVIAQKVDELTKELHEVRKDKLLKETQLPPEILEQLGLPVNPPSRLKRGRGYRPLLAHEILEAKKAIVSKKGFFNEAMVARYLNVSYPTYKKYARLLGVWEPNPNIRGKKTMFDPERGHYPLSEILLGKHPDYPVFRIKDKLIRSQIKEAKCELCGFREKRMVDGKIPLILNFMDGNEKNHALENMKLYCYNCTFTSGKGYVRSGIHHFDPDWLQDGEKEAANETARYL
jgi:hypothetical protein